MDYSEYDAEALRQIHTWKNRQSGWLDRAMAVFITPLDKAGDKLLAAPGVGHLIKLSVEGITKICNDVAQWSISPASVYKGFRKAGHENVHGATDIFSMKLEDIDKLTSSLATKYKSVSLAEGAGLGVMGLPGIPPDLMAIFTLNFRAIGEYATYYGFDISSQSERLFALNILGLATSSTVTGKGLAMAQLVRIARTPHNGRHGDSWNNTRSSRSLKEFRKHWE